MRAWGIDIRAGLILVFALGLFGGPAAAQMTTTGAFSVDDSGTANFQIPIAVPPGVGGIVPSLSLVYSSQALNGPLGVGWSLNGVSLITRCPRTLPQDGVRGGVKFNADDRFCMDGQRLMGAGGTYGAANSSYRTELDSFAKVTSHGTAGSGPAFFAVRTKTGLVLEFGNTADSRIEAPGRPEIRVWALNRITDTTGNYLTVQYTKNAASGTYRPNRIDYTGNVAAGVSPGASVRFVYGSRPDQLVAFDAGGKVQTTERMTKVQTYLGSTLVMDYRLDYEASPTTGASRLKTVTQCDGGGTCLPPVTLTWSGTAPATFQVLNIINGWNTAGPNAAFLRLGDVTGDGRPDVVKFEPASGTIRVNRNNGALNFMTDVLSTTVSGGDMENRRFILADINGDAREDVLIYRPLQGMVDVSLSKGDGSFHPAVSSTFKTAPTKITFPANNNYTVDGPAHHLDINDYNNDGIPDLLLVIPGICNSTAGPLGTSWVAYGNGAGGFGAPQSVNFSVCNSNFSYDILSFHLSETTILENLIFQDVDGDGVIDRSAFYTTRYQAGSNPVQYGYCDFFFKGEGGVNLNNSAGITNPSQFFVKTINGTNENYICAGTAENNERVVVASPTIDANGDGVWDYLSFSESTPGTLAVGRGRGDGTFDTASATIDLASLATYPWFSVGDINGDGLSDVVAITSAASSGVANIFYAQRDGAYVKVSNNIGIDGNAENRWVEVVDIDGNGLAEVFVYTPALGQVRIWRQQPQMPDRVTRFEDGLGSGVSVTYSSLTEANVYLKDTTATAPIVDLTLPYPVVYEAAFSDGIGGVRTTRYAYFGLKAERNGRGLLGFRMILEQFLDTGAITRKEYRQDWPYTGLLERRTVYVPGPSGGPLQYISTQFNTYGCLHPVDGATCTVAPGKIYFPYAAQVWDRAWELDGTELPGSDTTTSYDRFGNATQVSVVTADGHGKTTVNSFTNDEANWLLGRLTGSTVTAASPDVTP